MQTIHQEICVTFTMIMKKSYFNQIKKEDPGFSLFKTYQKQDQKKLDEIDTKIIPHYSYPSSILSYDETEIRSFKLTPKLYIGNQRFSKSCLEDKKLIEKVKKHLDQEHLEKYRNKYVFNPSPPRPEIHDDCLHSQLNMTLKVSTHNPKTFKSSKPQFKKINTKISKKNTQLETSNEVQTNEHDSINNDDLPIALRRTKRPVTKPLRYWLGEKIVYKIDNETGCYTKAYEIKVNENENCTEKQEFVLKRNSSTDFIAKEKSLKFEVENGEIFIIINNKKFKASVGCKFFLLKGQKMIFDNKSDDDAKLTFI